MDEASASGLAQGETITFSSMVISADDEMFLASVKAVGGAYPLRGALSVDGACLKHPLTFPNPGQFFWRRGSFNSCRHL